MARKRTGRVPLAWSLLFLLVISLASMTFPVHAASSDLTVDSIWLEDASQVGQPVSQVSPGQSFNIVATIKNIGQDTASGYYLDVYYDSDYGRGGPDNIAPGEVQTWYVGPLTAQAGTHTTKWVVDPDNQIVEMDETNNQKELAFTVGSQTTTTTVTSSSPSSTTKSTSTTTVTQTSSSTPSTTQSTSTSTTSSSPSSTSSTVNVTVKLLNHAGNGLSGGVVQYYSGGWRSFGTTGSDGTVSMRLAPGTYGFQISWAGAILQKGQNVALDPNVVFQTTLVTVKLLAHDGVTVLNGAAQYYAGGWKMFGGGTTTATMELLPLTYGFQIVWAGAGQQKGQNVALDPNVVFQTTLVTMRLLNHDGSSELSGAAQYYDKSGSFRTFGGGTTTTTMELFPLNYTFKISWAGASNYKTQDISKNANVIFQTVQVHSDSGKCTGYYAGTLQTFTQDMELLPGTYTFRFSDGTANTSYTLVVGVVKHIH